MRGQRIDATVLLIWLFALIAVPYRVTAADSPREAILPLVLGAEEMDIAWDRSNLDRYTALVGRAPGIVGWYQDWADGTFRPEAMDAIAARGGMPMVTWEPFDHTRGRAPDERYALGRIATGEHDAYIRSYARDAMRWGRPFFLRFAQEMNGDWMSWSSGVSGNTPGDFVAAWRHIHDIFQEEGATNVRWVWSPNCNIPRLLPFAAFYPGDTYVDWAALDCYNPGTGAPGYTWMSLSDILADSYAAITALTPRPLMLAEVASSEIGGDKADWILQGLLSDLPVRFPRINAVIWFDANFVAKGEQDWRIDSSVASLSAFRTVASAPIYQGALR